MSWRQVSDILRRDREDAAREASEPPTDCPNDGTPLQQGPSGVLHCPFDGWVWEG